jgi:ligand-binding sensor domain-containing protein
VNSYSQPPQLTFQHVNIEHGLPDGTVRSVTQDKYGYIWLGTQYGLCRYNGYNITPYFHNKGDTTSIAGNFIWNLFTDKEGNVWIGNDGFFSRYDYAHNNFKNYQLPGKALVVKTAEDEKGMLWLAGSGGLMKFDKQKGTFTLFTNITGDQQHLEGWVNDLIIDKDKGIIYLGTNRGFRVFNYRTEKVEVSPIDPADDPYNINGNLITALTRDKNGLLWIGCGFTNTVLVKWDPSTKKINYYNDLTTKNRGWSENRTLSLFTDRNGNVWAGGFTSSLSLYLPREDIFYHYQHDALLRSSVAGNSVNTIYQDQSGMIWTGMEGYGADRFQPINNLFTTFQPQAAVQPSLLHDWGRAAIEDSRGQFWLGTSKGISVYDPVKSQYRNYFNDEKNPSLISFNTIRSFEEDSKGNIWIGTGNGLNRYDPASGKFRIYGWADSLKSYFVWSLLETRNGRLYIGGTGGLQQYDQFIDKFIPPEDDPIMNNKLRYNIRNLFEDSKQGLWLGVQDGGLIYYHPANKTIVHYRHDEKDPGSLCNNFVTSVIEDKKGTIWIATRDGLNSFDPRTKSFHVFTVADGLPSNKTSALRVDSANRLWIATGNGLSVLEPEGCMFRNFSLSDGLPTNEFNDQQASTTRDGRFIYPSYRGFILFKPEEVQQKKWQTPSIYASSIKVFNSPLTLSTNTEEIKKLDLRYHQNFFSLEMIALNYENPEKIYYAYKLEPFNKDWVYTRDRNVSFTNVPGGNYTFYYKATMDPSDWNVTAQELHIHIGTVFYKTWWFLLLGISLVAATIYLIYSYRFRQARRMMKLQLQATRLEKDKTEIQYQNLINQFNPHFLFNSLTSLNSLIYENRELASEFLEQLSTVYRYLLTHKETQLVTLQEEKEFVGHYIHLLKTRFGNALSVRIDIPASLLKKKIVPVSFQLLIENAIKHNIADEEMPLLISFTADERYLYVTNNLQRKAYVENSNRKGLESLQTLYKYLSLLPFIIEEENDHFTIKLPLL